MPTSNREPSLPKRRNGRRGPVSKMILRRMKAAEELVGAIRYYREQVAAGVATRLSPGLSEGEVLPDTALTLELVGRSVEADLEQLLAADGRHVRQKVRYALHRQECERVARKEVYPVASKLRRSVDSVFTRKVGRRVHGIEGRVLRKPWRLRDQLDVAVPRLRDRSFELPEPEVAGFTADREAWLEEIEPAYDKLVSLTDELRRHELRRDDLCRARQEAMDEFDRNFGEAHGFVAGAFTLAGLHPKLVRNLRSYLERRRLASQARQKRRARRERAASARPVEAPVAPDGRILRFRSAVERWLPKSWRKAP